MKKPDAIELEVLAAFRKIRGRALKSLSSSKSSSRCMMVKFTTDKSTETVDVTMFRPEEGWGYSESKDRL